MGTGLKDTKFLQFGGGEDVRLFWEKKKNTGETMSTNKQTGKSRIGGFAHVWQKTAGKGGKLYREPVWSGGGGHRRKGFGVSSKN